MFLGRLHPTKGIFDLIPIWKEVVSDLPKARLAVIGGGQEYLSDYLQKLIQKEGLSENVFLLGVIPDKKVFSLMKKAKVFLFTDHEAGWGLAVAEAMVCGLTVVGYDNGLLGTVYKAGFRKVPLGNHHRFANETKQLLRERSVRVKLAREAKRQAMKLDWERTSRKFSLILGEMTRR